MTATHDLYEEFKQKLHNEGISQGISRGISRGISQGRAQGLLPLVHLFERRLGRTLSAAEHEALLTRFSTLGPDRLGDVVLDLAPDALSVWLAAPDAPCTRAAHVTSRAVGERKLRHPSAIR